MVLLQRTKIRLEEEKLRDIQQYSTFFPFQRFS
jgi:hypothetical protein